MIFYHLRFQSKDNESPSISQLDLLQQWLDNQLDQFHHRIQPTSSSLIKKSNRFSRMNNNSTDDESDTVRESTYPISNSKSTKRSTNYKRYRSMRRNTNLVRHESLKFRNRPLGLDKNSLAMLKKRTDSSSIPHSDLSDLSSSRPDHLSESILSNHGSEYDNMYTQDLNFNRIPAKNNSQILTDDDSDDQTTLATAIYRPCI